MYFIQLEVFQYQILVFDGKQFTVYTDHNHDNNQPAVLSKDGCMMCNVNAFSSLGV